jgi:DNA-binding IscR family transcriptional regulator
MPAWGQRLQGARSLCRTKHQRESDSESERQRRMSKNAPQHAAATLEKFTLNKLHYQKKHQHAAATIGGTHQEQSESQRRATLF